MKETEIGSYSTHGMMRMHKQFCRETWA